MSPSYQNYYRASAPPLASQPMLEGGQKADVAILGAGYTGLSCALELRARGFDVAIIEAEDVGYGASGRNGGHVCSGWSNDIAKMEKRIGAEDAKLCWDFAREAVDMVKTRIESYDIDCGLRWGYISAANRPRHFEELKHTQDDWQRYGYNNHRLYDRAELSDHLKSPIYFGGLWEGGAGQLHPLKFCRGLARAALADGVRIYEQSPVIQIKADQNKPALVTEKGQIEAGFLVLCGNAYLGRVEPRLFRRLAPVSSYILATPPLSDEQVADLIPNRDTVAGTDWVLDYYRIDDDNRLVFGGRATYSGIEPRDLGQFVYKRMVRVFPQLKDTKPDYAWGGSIGITVDRMPHFGRLGTKCYFAQGFCGHGVAATQVAGRILAEAVFGQATRLDLMTRFKHPIFPGGRFRHALLSMAMLYYRLLDQL